MNLPSSIRTPVHYVKLTPSSHHQLTIKSSQRAPAGPRHYHDALDPNTELPLEVDAGPMLDTMPSAGGAVLPAMTHGALRFSSCNFHCTPAYSKLKDNSV